MTVAFGVRIAPALLERFDRLCAETGRVRSQFIGELMARAVIEAEERSGPRIIRIPS